MINKNKFEIVINFLKALNFLEVCPCRDGFLYAYKDLLIVIYFTNNKYNATCISNNLEEHYPDLKTEFDLVDTLFKFLHDNYLDLLEFSVRKLPAHYQELMITRWAEANGYDVKDSKTLTAYINYINSKEVK
jgi:hypothetical protein